MSGHNSATKSSLSPPSPALHLSLLSDSDNNSNSNSNRNSPENSTINISKWLRKHRLLKYEEIFHTHQISVEELLEFTPEELQEYVRNDLHLDILYQRRLLTALKKTQTKSRYISPANEPRKIKDRDKEFSPSLEMKKPKHHQNKGSILKTLSTNLQLLENADTDVIEEETETTYDQSSVHDPNHTVHAPLTPLYQTSTNDLRPRSAIIGRKRNSVRIVRRPKPKSRKYRRRNSTASPLSAVMIHSPKRKTMNFYSPQLSPLKNTNHMIKHNHSFSLSKLPDRKSIASKSANALLNKRMNVSSAFVYSDDEKFGELLDIEVSSHKSMTTSEKQSMENINMSLNEIIADQRQITSELKSLDDGFENCEQEINQYFQLLFIDLKNKKQQMLQLLDEMKHEKQKQMQDKSLELRHSHRHIIQHKYKCESMIRNQNYECNIQEREHAIQQLAVKAVAEQMVSNFDSDSTSTSNNNNDEEKRVQIEHLFTNDEPQMNVEFDVQLKHEFMLNLGFIKTGEKPSPPIIDICTFSHHSMFLRLTVMDSRLKKRINRFPNSNESKNKRVLEIEVEYIQIKHVLKENMLIKSLNSSDGSSHSNYNRNKKKKKHRKYKPNRKKRRQSLFSKEKKVDDKKEQQSNISLASKPMEEIGVYFEMKRVIRIMIDKNKRFKRIHECNITDILAGHECKIRARCQTVNGWSVWSMPSNKRMPIKTRLHFDSSLKGNGCLFDKNDRNLQRIIFNSKCANMNNDNIYKCLALANTIIKRKECNSFAWKFKLEFMNINDEEQSNTVIIASDSEEEYPLLSHVASHAVCMGFVSYPIEESVNDTFDCTLGQHGTQFGIFVSLQSKDVRVFSTRSDSLHVSHTFTMSEAVVNGDEFRFECNIVDGYCCVFHNQTSLGVIFTDLPANIIPGVSAFMHCKNDEEFAKIAVEIEFVHAN